MHLMPDFHPTGLGTIDGPAVLDRDAREVPSGPVERERFAGSKLRYIGQNTQASLARRVRERQRRDHRRRHHRVADALPRRADLLECGHRRLPS